MTPAFLTVHTLACAAVFVGSFCRLRRTNADTRPSVRRAFWLLASAALIQGAAPWLWAWLPFTAGLSAGWMFVPIPVASALLLAATSPYWTQSGGVPHYFQRKP